MSLRNKYFLFTCKVLLLTFLKVSSAMASDKPFETFDPNKSRNWSFFTDGVMGEYPREKHFLVKVALITLYGLREMYQLTITVVLYRLDIA